VLLWLEGHTESIASTASIARIVIVAASTTAIVLVHVAFEPPATTTGAITTSSSVSTLRILVTLRRVALRSSAGVVLWWRCMLRNMALVGRVRVIRLEPRVRPLLPLHVQVHIAIHSVTSIPSIPRRVLLSVAGTATRTANGTRGAVSGVGGMSGMSGMGRVLTRWRRRETALAANDTGCGPTSVPVESSILPIVGPKGLSPLRVVITSVISKVPRSPIIVPSSPSASPPSSVPSITTSPYIRRGRRVPRRRRFPMRTPRRLLQFPNGVSRGIVSAVPPTGHPRIASSRGSAGTRLSAKPSILVSAPIAIIEIAVKPVVGSIAIALTLRMCISTSTLIAIASPTGMRRIGLIGSRLLTLWLVLALSLVLMLNLLRLLLRIHILTFSLTLSLEGRRATTLLRLTLWTMRLLTTLIGTLLVATLRILFAVATLTASIGILLRRGRRLCIRWSAALSTERLSTTTARVTRSDGHIKHWRLRVGIPIARRSRRRRGHQFGTH